MTHRVPALALALLSLVIPACAKPAAEAPEESAVVAPGMAPAPSRKGVADEAAATDAATPASPATLADAAVPAGRMLVRTVELTVEVRDTEAARAELGALAGRLGGYVDAVNAWREGELMRYTLTLRVPAGRLDEAIAAVRTLAVRVDREQQQTEDVTDQFVDLSARLRTLEATERELGALLAESRQRQRNVEDIMAVYRELAGIRAQIEQIQGQVNLLQKRAALSTLSVELVPTEAARPVAGPGWRPGDTVRGSVRALVELLRFLADAAIFAVIVLLPIGLVAWLALALLRRLWRRVRRPRPPAP